MRHQATTSLCPLLGLVKFYFLFKVVNYFCPFSFYYLYLSSRVGREALFAGVKWKACDKSQCWDLGFHTVYVASGGSSFSPIQPGSRSLSFHEMYKSTFFVNWRQSIVTGVRFSGTTFGVTEGIVPSGSTAKQSSHSLEWEELGHSAVQNSSLLCTALHEVPTLFPKFHHAPQTCNWGR